MLFIRQAKTLSYDSFSHAEAKTRARNDRGESAEAVRLGKAPKSEHLNIFSCSSLLFV